MKCLINLLFGPFINVFFTNMQIMKEMGGECSTHDRDQKVYELSVRTQERHRS